MGVKIEVRGPDKATSFRDRLGEMVIRWDDERSQTLAAQLYGLMESQDETQSRKAGAAFGLGLAQVVQGFAEEGNATEPGGGT